MANYYSNLKSGAGSFSSMMLNGFGVVTVMNAKVYEPFEDVSNMHAADIIDAYKQRGNELCELKTLKIANVTVEGPDKTVTGGQYNNPLIKFGKSARLEMQDALGKAKAIEHLCGGLVEYNDQKEGTVIYALHNGEDFQGPKAIIGDSFFIDQKTGQQVKVKIIFYNFLPDSLFNLTQDAEGDATVFDMNGDLLVTEILIGTDGNEEHAIQHGEFYSIVADQADVAYYHIENNQLMLESEDYSGTLDGADIPLAGIALDADKAYKLVIKDEHNNIVVDKVILG